ncbi:MBL fold metallo-hydrolase [Acetobacter sp.]|uniref:MBL fold metallo-hydrolase n=1 Tax=Acetobacter sp. TaxID=440 RepID=UPI0039E84D8F
MKVSVLGCGGSSGVPALGGPDGHGQWGTCDPAEPRNRRSRASIFLRMEDGCGVLVDTGPDLRAQLLAHGISAFGNVIYTHAHADHVSGLDELRGINRQIGKAITAYGTAEVLGELQERFGYVFKPHTSPHFFRATLDVHPVPWGQHINIGGYAFTLFEQNHGYVTSTGVRCGAFAYSTDVVELPEPSVACLRGVHTWMVDCFQKTPHGAHAWLDRVLEWKALIQPERVILTHMGAEMDWGWMREHLPPGVEAAWDGMSFELPDPPRAG